MDFAGDSRSSGFADFDGDGDVDVIVTGLHSPQLFRNRSDELKNNWLKIKLVGSASNRDGIGSRVIVAAENLKQYFDYGSAGGGFASSGDRALYIGLDKKKTVHEIEVRWPSGRVQKLSEVPVNQLLKIQEVGGKR